MDHRPKPKTILAQKKKKEKKKKDKRNSFDLGLSKDFLETAPKAKSTKERKSIN